MNRKIIFASTLFLASCATAEVVPVAKVECLPKEVFVNYSAAQQKQAAAELEKLPKGNELTLMMRDYAKVWKAEKACLGG